MNADKLLFKEAQFLYSQRMVTLQKQVVIDNLHYIMFQKIFGTVYTTPDEAARRQRNQKVIDLGKRWARANDDGTIR